MPRTHDSRGRRAEHHERREARRDDHLQRREVRRTELLDAATEAVRRIGADASMEQIAAEAGVTKPILYRHFGDRSGLVEALGDRLATELMGRIGAAISGDDDPEALLRRGIDTFLEFVEREPALYRFVVGPDSAEAVAGFVRRIGQQVALVVGEQLRLRGADSGGAEAIGHGIVGMVHASGDWWVQARVMPRARLVDYLTSVLWRGLDALAPVPPAVAATTEAAR